MINFFKETVFQLRKEFTNNFCKLHTQSSQCNEEQKLVGKHFLYSISLFQKVIFRLHETSKILVNMEKIRVKKD